MVEAFKDVSMLLPGAGGELSPLPPGGSLSQGAGSGVGLELYPFWWYQAFTTLADENDGGREESSSTAIRRQHQEYGEQ